MDMAQAALDVIDLSELTPTSKQVDGPTQEPDPVISDFAKVLEEHREAIPAAIMNHIDKLQRQIDFSRGGKYGPPAPDPVKAAAGVGEAELVKRYLLRMDDELLARDGSAELSHEEAKQALRDVYLLSCGERPEFHPNRTGPRAPQGGCDGN